MFLNEYIFLKKTKLHEFLLNYEMLHMYHIHMYKNEIILNIIILKWVSTGQIT